MPPLQSSPAPTRRQRRDRPVLVLTLAADIDRAIRERAKQEGRPISRIADDAVRAGLGMLPAPPERRQIP